MRRASGTGWQGKLTVALALVLAAGLTTAAGAESVLRIVPQADLKILDTVWTTNNITSNHGYMIYDVLFAPNAKLEYKPQMVDTYSKSADGLVWRLKLRDGLQFSDGTPVQAKDAVASLKRWGDRVPVGKTLLQFAKEVVTTDRSRSRSGLTSHSGRSSRSWARRKTRCSSTERRRPRPRPTSRSPRPSAPAPS
jgi:peptide/nickel transport system substrate-binding protein